MRYNNIANKVNKSHGAQKLRPSFEFFLAIGYLETDVEFTVMVIPNSYAACHWCCTELEN